MMSAVSSQHELLLLLYYHHHADRLYLIQHTHQVWQRARR